MRQLKRKRTFFFIDGYLAVLILCVAAVVAIMFVNKFDKSPSPVAEGGILDLSGWDLKERGRVALDGEWEFYPGQLLTPEELQAGSVAGKRLLNVPGVWNGEGIGAWGSATYRLRVRVDPTDELLAIQKRIIRFSENIFVNGKLVGGSGEPAPTRDEYRPGNMPYPVSFYVPEDGELDIVIQVANFDFKTGGIVSHLRLGLHSDIQFARFLQISLEWAGVLLLFAFSLFYFLTHFFLSRQRSFLLFGAFNLLFAVTILLNGERSFLQVFPEAPFELTWKLKDLTMFLPFPIMLGFVYSMFRKLPVFRAVLTVAGGTVLAYCAFIVFVPYYVYAYALEYFLASIPLSYGLLAIALSVLYMRGEYGAFGKREMQLFIASLLSLTLFPLNMVINMLDDSLAMFILTDALAYSFGVLTFMMFAVRYIDTYRSMEKLTGQLKEADRYKTEFLLRTSHELNTPLNGIINLSQAAMDAPSGTAGVRQNRDKLLLIRNTAFRMSNMVNDVIDLAKIEDGKLEVELGSVDLAAVVSIQFEMHGFLSKEKKVTLSRRIADDARYVVADEARLKQVMSNLVSYALQHTARGELAVSSARGGEDVVVAIKAKGGGAPETHAAEQAGFGIGLSVARQLIERMGGQLMEEAGVSEDGIGFEVRLPAASGTALAGAEKSRAETAAASEPAARSAGSAGVAGGTDTVLIAGEWKNSEIMANLLAIEGYRVVTAHTDKEALEFVSRPQRPDLVLLDVMLSGGKGYETGRQIRKLFTQIELPILYLMAGSTQADVEACLSAGGNDVIAKPIDAGEVRVRIRTQLAMKRLAREAAQNEMAFLQSQIKPHFLYNALGTIMSLCYTDGVRAGELLSVLSTYLRILFHHNRMEEIVPLEQEIELIQAYVDIEKARFGQRLNVKFEYDEELLGQSIMPLTIQPLVENAIRHGVARKVNGGTVSISIRRKDRFAEVIVEDDGVGMPEARRKELLEPKAGERGVGFANIMKRLTHRTGKRPLLESVPDRGTKVTFWLPLDERDEKEGRDEP